MESKTIVKRIKEKLNIIKDHPKKGVNFIDITSLILDGEHYKYAIDEMVKLSDTMDFDYIVGPEARGFIVGCPIAYALGKGYIPIRKKEKLPREVLTTTSFSEYSKVDLSIHKNDLKKGDKVLIVDDVLATGGTIQAIIHMLETMEVEIVGTVFLIQIEHLNGKNKVKSKIESVMKI